MVRWGSSWNPFSNQEIEDVNKEGRLIAKIDNSGAEGAFGLPQKFPEISKYN